jgi:hypothetical protein
LEGDFEVPLLLGKPDSKSMEDFLKMTGTGPAKRQSAGVAKFHIQTRIGS